MRAPLTAADVAALVEGRLTDGVGGGEPLLGVAPLDQAGPHDLSFLASKKYLDQFHASQAGAVLVTPEFAAALPGPAVRIVVPDPHKAMQAVLRVLFPAPPRPLGIHPTARIGAGATLGEDVAIGAYAVIGDGCRIGARAVIMESVVLGAGVTVGEDCVLHPQVVCYANTVMGARVILHAGVRLGVDGFGYVQTAAGHERVPHVGRCRVEDDVEIGANTCVDRGSIGDTVIGAGTKIDNLVHIAHNCRIGRRCLIMGQVGIAGSTSLEDEVILAGQAGLTGHITIGKRARITAQSGISMDVAPGETMSGYPARAHRDVMRANAALYRLAKIVHEIEELVERERKHG